MSRGKQLLVTSGMSSLLQAESLPGVPLIEIYGQRRVLIENHQGIVGYGCNEILVKVRYGRICVCGECLKLVKMGKEKLVITGRIFAVNLQGRS